MGLQAKDLMVKTDIVVSESMPISELAEKLYKMRIGGLPVLNAAKEFSGVVSVADVFSGIEIVRGFFGSKALWASLFLAEKRIIRVKDIYRREAVHVLKETPVENVVNLMLQEDLHAIPVTNEEKTVFYGVIGRYEVTRLLFAAVD